MGGAIGTCCASRQEAARCLVARDCSTVGCDGRARHNSRMQRLAWPVALQL